MGLFVLLLSVISWRVAQGRWWPKIRWFPIGQIEITSEWPLSVSEARSWLNPLEGRNLLFLSSEELVQQLIAKPWVDKATIRKEFPNRLVVGLQTKKAVAILLIQQEPYFLSAGGEVIEKANSFTFRALDLPIVTWSKVSQRLFWDLSEVVNLLQTLRTELGARFSISELVLEAYPYFKVFLHSPKAAAVFSFENFRSQIPYLRTLLQNPPLQIEKPKIINMVFPKKAIVSLSSALTGKK
ncbi:MAG: FtsQ-type POTRA domain-containing protein [Deltaproteobacteria bacterium]|nr:FtsQ-type POTRA domain-containing protein [Deltaproteobacteria bacterium]